MDLSLRIILISAALVLAAIGIALLASMALKKRAVRRYDLSRSHRNPIVSPEAARDWESEGTFNPGAVLDDDGTVHIFYRALGRDGLSRIGHAASKDGHHFYDRSPYPVYVPQSGEGMPDERDVPGPHRYDLSAHASGGGWGGAEDPRVVKLDGRIYMTYTAFESWDNMRIGLTSIGERDMKHRRWSWRRPIIISPRKMRAKNWVLFPEKIKGRYAILHGIAPSIKIAYVDSPEMVPSIASLNDHGGGGYEVPSRKGYWDHAVRGAGAPPLKTDLGWLLIYHALDKRDPKRIVGYKVGVMILDRDDPTRVLYRSPEPILSPDAHYENDGKPGVVYASGAVIKDGRLLIYYGGGDRHTCVAETPLRDLLNWLQAYGRV